MFSINERFVVIDTETTNTYSDTKGRPDMSDVICYDVGFIVTDKNGYIYETYSFVVKEVFNDKEWMNSAYFAKKIPIYRDDIEHGKRIVMPIMDIWRIFKEVCRRFNVRIIAAHNARFDCRALNNTLRYLTGSKYRYWLPSYLTWWDTLKMASQVLGDDDMYWLHCQYMGCMTRHTKPRPSYSAENVYRYISENFDFVESHTGLEDVLIEKDILCYCLYHEPDINGKLWND